MRESLREKLNKMAIEEYNKDGDIASPNNDSMDGENNADSTPTPPSASSDDVSTEKEPASEQPFTQDDLPF